MRKFTTSERLEKITNTVHSRQYDVNLVIENIHDPHNVSAIFRTCDAVGIPRVSLLYTKEKFPKISKTSSASAFKWISKESFSNSEDCFSKLKDKGFKIYSSMLDPNSTNLYDLDLTGPTALVFGNEHRGVSEDVLKYTDKSFYIPMRGMIQSLNVSVAAAVTLYELQRQREKNGNYLSSILSDDKIEKIIDEWCERK